MIEPVQDTEGKIVITADNPVSCLYEFAKKVMSTLSQL